MQQELLLCEVLKKKNTHILERQLNSTSNWLDSFLWKKHGSLIGEMCSYGGIQAILTCIFDKFRFQTHGWIMLENDAEIDNFTLVYFPVSTLINEFFSPNYFNFSFVVVIQF